MSVMVQRAEAVRRYGSLAGAVPVEQIEALPPYLTSCLDAKRRVSRVWSEPMRFAGTARAVFRDLPVGDRRLRVCMGGLKRPILRELDLDDHRQVAPAQSSLELIGAALLDLRRHRPHAFRLIAELTSMVVWIERAAGGRCLLSCSFPELPFATFVTDEGLAQIPLGARPFPAGSFYPIQENFLHESLHHLLSQTLFAKQAWAVSPEVITETHVHIPWRGLTWDLELALHGYIVYAHVAGLRRWAWRRAADGDERSILREAIGEADEACAVLRSGIHQHDRLTTAHGKKLLAEIDGLR